MEPILLATVQISTRLTGNALGIIHFLHRVTNLTSVRFRFARVAVAAEEVKAITQHIASAGSTFKLQVNYHVPVGMMNN